MLKIAFIYEGISHQITGPGVCLRAIQRATDSSKFTELFVARSKAFGNCFQVYKRVGEVHPCEMRRVNRSPHGIAPEVLQQPLFVINKADEDARDAVLRGSP
jgi:hypothetical protein